VCKGDKEGGERMEGIEFVSREEEVVSGAGCLTI